MNFLKKYNKIRSRFDEEKGYWITTKKGHKIFIDENGDIAKGNPIVIGYMKSGDYRKHSIRLSESEKTKITKLISKDYSKYEKNKGEICGFNKDGVSYIFYNINLDNYIFLHKAVKPKNKEKIYKALIQKFHNKDVCICLTDLTKEDISNSEINKIKTKEEYFKFVKE